MPQAGYVYIVHGVGTSFIKVGKSANFLSRLEMLENGVPFALEILSVELVYDVDKAEQALLQRYARYHTRGEWFALPEELLAEWPIEAGALAFSDEPMRTLPSRLREAIAWLEQALTGGPRSTTLLFAECEAVGIAEKTLRRAKEVLAVRALKERGSASGQWYWQLPITEVTHYALEPEGPQP
jgi:hypothetical protein